MDRMDALHEWWADPDAVVIPAGETDQIIEWLGQQSPDTWHQVVMSWNYDYGYRVLYWILEQENCDKGTAALIFLVVGTGQWLWDAFENENFAQNSAHVCNMVLRNWRRYRTGELKHGYDIPEQILQLVREKGDKGGFENTPLQEIINYEGNREAVSKYASHNGQIVVAFDFWMKSKGIALSAK